MKKTIYYLYNEVASYEGIVVSTFYFIDIETEELLIINVSSNDRVKNSTYYKSIEQMKRDYNILWNEDDKYIYPLEESFDEIKKSHNVLKLTKC